MACCRLGWRNLFAHAERSYPDRVADKFLSRVLTSHSWFDLSQAQRQAAAIGAA
jgi:hypothetical protein